MKNFVPIMNGLICILTILVIGIILIKPSIIAKQESVGRYTMVFNPNIKSDAFILDTTTGDVWHPIVLTNAPGQPAIWHKMDIIRNAEDEKVFSEVKKNLGGQ